MAVTSTRRNTGRRRNPARRRLTAKQIAAGFGGKRRQSAQKASRKAHRRRSAPKAHRRRSAPRAAAVQPNRSHRRRRAHSNTRRHRTRRNVGKIISLTLPGESTMAKTRSNRSRKRSSAHRRRRTTTNSHRRRSTRRNPSMGDMTALATNAVFTVAGAVGTRYLTQMVLGTSNTGPLGYIGNVIAAFALGAVAHMFPATRKAAPALVTGGIVALVIRLIGDYTPYGNLVSNLGGGDAGLAGVGLGAYQRQSYYTPQTLQGPWNPYSSALAPASGQWGLGGCCNDLYAGGGGLYAAA